MKDIIKTDNLSYKSKSSKVYTFSEYSLPIVFFKDIHAGHLSLKDADDKQNNIAAKTKNLDKGWKTVEKQFFKDNLGLLFSSRKIVFSNFKSRSFPIKQLDKISTCEPKPGVGTEPTKAVIAKSKLKMSSLTLREEVLNKIKNEEKNKNKQTFREYFNYWFPLFLVKNLYEDNQNKSNIIVKYLNKSLIDLGNSINSKKNPENENPKK